MVFSRDLSAQYAVGDLGSTSSGNWTSPATWSSWNGAAWVLPGGSGTPSSLTNVFILTGTIVDLSSSPQPCLNLKVETGGKLWSGPGSNFYISVYGSTLICDGIIGNGAIFDQISFNIESANCTISGIGTFDASRMRKSSNINLITNLIISRDINLRWNSASASAQLYNNATLTTFNVTINAGAAVDLIQSGPSTGNVCIDGNNGNDGIDGGGTFTVDGKLIVSGILYLTTNNASPAYITKWIINGLVQAYEVVAPNSGAATNSLTVNNMGKLELTGTPAFSSLGTTNNSYIFNNGSTVKYSAAGNQNVRVRSEFALAPLPINGYYNLILDSSGNKTTSFTDLWIRNDLTIMGSAILDPIAGTPSNIYVGGNWLNYNSIGFNEKTTTVVANGTGLQTITCPGGEVYYVLQYQKTLGNHLQFNDSVDVIFQLSFGSGGYVDLNSNVLTIRNPAPNGPVGGIRNNTNARYIMSEKPDNSSKIIWKINTATGVYTFPFGVPPGGALNYIPVILGKSNALPIGDVAFSTYGTALADNVPWPTTPTLVTNLKAYIAQHNVPDNQHWTVDRFWEVSATTPVAVDSVKFTYRIIERPDSDTIATNLGAQYWNYWDGPYWLPTQFGTGIAYSVNVPSFIKFNTSWTLTSITSPLPIKLLYFDAQPEDDKVKLSWSTASEINNDYFTIEKSIDGSQFFPIGNVSGSGNSTIKLQYYFDDTKPFFGISYYRLKQTDFDGAFTYSRAVPVNFKKEMGNFAIFPNPANDNAYLISETSIKAEIFIRNTEGKIILHYLVDKYKQIQPLQISELKQGLYFVEVKSELETHFLKLIKN